MKMSSLIGSTSWGVRGVKAPARKHAIAGAQPLHPFIFPDHGAAQPSARTEHGASADHQVLFAAGARTLGGSDFRIIFRHVLPNGMGPVLVSAGFGLAAAILVESTLSFLGFGVPQPKASWGTILFDGRNDIMGAWWLTVFPGRLYGGR